MINEGAKILEEGMAIRASDIDVIWINGYSWPKYRGGPMWHADNVGLDNVVAQMLRVQEGVRRPLGAGSIAREARRRRQALPGPLIKSPPGSPEPIS